MMVWMACHRLRVSLLSVKWLLIFWAYDRFAFLMPQDRWLLLFWGLLYLLIWMLHLWSLAAHKPLLSSTASGLHVWWWSWWLSHHPCTFWCKQSQFQCTPAGLCGCVGGRLFKHVPVCAWKQSCSVEVASSGQIVMSFWTGMASFRSGLYAGISITEMWSEYLRWGRGTALYAFFSVV